MAAYYLITQEDDYFCDRCRLRLPGGTYIARFPRSTKGFCERCAHRLQQRRSQSQSTAVRRRYGRAERRREVWAAFEWQMNHPPPVFRGWVGGWLWDRWVMRQRRRVVLSRHRTW